MINCWGHQKENTPQARGNWLADKATKYAAEKFGAAGGGSIRTFVLSKMPELTLTLPQYTLAQDQLWCRKGHQKWKRLVGTARWQVTGTQGIRPYTGVSGSPGNQLGTWQNGRINLKTFNSTTFFLMWKGILELFCLLTGQCCPWTQTKTFNNTVKRHSTLWTFRSGLYWDKTLPTLSLFTGHGMYLLRMGWGLPYMNWKSKWSGLLSASGNNPQIHVPTKYMIRQWPCFHSWFNSTGI